jgi:hypothetical protein
MTHFTIDFFEFSFLVEACIPPRPIARTSFFQDVINIHHNQMTKEERKHLFNWLNRNSYYTESLENKEELCLHFQARFNPDNQYVITTNFQNKVEQTEAYLFDGKYHIQINRSVAPEYITKIEKL